MPQHPFQLAAGVVVTYAASQTAFNQTQLGKKDSTLGIKVISGVHALLITVVGVYALSQPWPIVLNRANAANVGIDDALDDSRNPLVFGTSELGKKLTAWEFGYLFYDTLACVIAKYEASPPKDRSIQNAFLSFALNEPATYGHHVILVGILGTLQYFISQGRERGVWIVCAFILMNGSTPLLHWRWWQKKLTGRGNLAIDAAFILIFGACRLGTIWYVLHRYGHHHGIGALDGMWRQRLICRVGTGGLFALNAIWLATLVKNTVRRVVKG